VSNTFKLLGVAQHVSQNGDTIAFSMEYHQFAEKNVEMEQICSM
jgi:hypothetical protein